MTIKLIAQAIGLQADADDSAVVTMVSQLTAFAGELKTLTKAPTLEAAIGAIRGLQATAEQVPVLTAKLSEQGKEIEAQKRATLIAADKADPKGRKLTPALEAFWATQSLEAFEGFLAQAPHLLQVQTAENRGQQQQPAMKSEGGAAAAVPVLTHEGKSWEAMTPAEKHNLKFTAQQVYDDLRANYVERGSPRAQSQQQRVSA